MENCKLLLFDLDGTLLRSDTIDEVKKKADFVIGGNDQEGISAYLEAFVN